MAKTSVLLIGTGLLGGTLLVDLVKTGEYDVSATTRNEKHLQVIKDLGAKPILASLDDTDIIKKAVAEHDVVINSASSDHPASIQATLDGIQERVNQNKPTIYLHTSGTGVIVDTAEGLKTTDLIYSDDDPDHFEENVDPGAVHRAIDFNIRNHAKKWYAETNGKTQVKIMIPPTIFGTGSGPFKTISIQIPSLIRAGIGEGYAAVHGDGKAVTGFVDVLDLADAYLVLLRSLEKDGTPVPKTPDDVYFFAEGGEEVAWGEVAERVGQLLYSKGAISSPELKQIPKDKQYQYYLTYDKKLWNGSKDYQSVGGNGRSRAVKLRQLGWKPSRSSREDLFKSLEKDVDEVLKENE